ncbi:DUF5723 family protein [uncultured Polaribacter sp.]|uniref:DUF5723 family protein n=1 Tax=uncultured Polaribacter sp. TaxID=174711 RepID=UPI002618EDF8|nr:DUF5723 family protein [uncultured Polaribacter sp.]
MKTFSQNKQVLYDFAGLPQTLLLNPGAETNFKYHVGIPLLSGVSFDFGSSQFVLSDLFAVDNIDINDKVASVLNSIDERDYLKINTQIEVLNFGFRLNNKTYLSAGFYEELDAIGYYPKDVLTFLTQGNGDNVFRNINLSEIRYKAELLGVFHLGITKKVNDKLTFGSRFKIYSSAFNLESKNNTGTFSTIQGTNNIYTQYLNNVDLNFKTAGIIRDDEYISDSSIFLNNTLLGGNLGLGLDFGVTYHITPQLQFSGSILDLGYVSYKNDIKNTKVEGDFAFEGLDFPLNNLSSIETWNELTDRFEEEVPVTDDNESYVSWRPTKLNFALKYSFGEKRSEVCYDNSYNDFFTDAVGVQLYSVFRPLSPQLALTGFYQKSLTKKIHTKITYTIDDFSYSNLGAGLSAQLGAVNLYGMIDNILEFKDLSSANSISFQMGINLIFN